MDAIDEYESSIDSMSNLDKMAFLLKNFSQNLKKYLEICFHFFFRESVYFQLKRRESEKKIHKKKFPLNLKNT